jgi:hypothetical protein
MAANKTLREHEALMTRMARTVGADLDEAELRGELPPEQRAAMLQTCTGCSDPIGCAQWLEDHATADAPPPYCRNGHVLNDLAGD